MTKRQNADDRWEPVAALTWASSYNRTERLAVPGGWLYRDTIEPYSEGSAGSVALVFVPFCSHTPSE